jgi:hypothetical protein
MRLIVSVKVVFEFCSAQQCCGAGGARNRIILTEQDPQRDAAPTQKPMYNIVEITVDKNVTS